MANEQNLKPFKKGKDERRNETGRPKKLPPIKELIEKTLGEEKNGISGVDAIFKVLLSKAVKGDLKASQMLLDYYYGKATQKTEITGAEGEKIQFKIDVIEAKENKPFEPE
jgi:hypothetical protein